MIDGIEHFPNNYQETPQTKEEFRSEKIEWQAAIGAFIVERLRIKSN